MTAAAISDHRQYQRDDRTFFLVDTGATMISLGASDAQRLGIDASKEAAGGGSYRQRSGAGFSRQTRYRTQVGEIVLHGVDALVHQQDMPVVLLGMSFLNRLEMQRDGQTMTLRKRY
ncbi:MAG: retroviral-like aspartic protease family protein [Candidatus Accumulibacter sp.]|uniref:retropepsin-like aspartic protease family protein n=1 Tax=Accumulibacter sp. TaxID=2053492 RepID=UPI0025DDF6DB|nr:retropepsin-like aspartic protease [Accumulibacter sp.]MCP5247726.1 retroviral-like aspartic protease family protein [Accumulibacter sp.]